MHPCACVHAPISHTKFREHSLPLVCCHSAAIVIPESPLSLNSLSFSSLTFSFLSLSSLSWIMLISLSLWHTHTYQLRGGHYYTCYTDTRDRGFDPACMLTSVYYKKWALTSVNYKLIKKSRTIFGINQAIKLHKIKRSRPKINFDPGQSQGQYSS